MPNDRETALEHWKTLATRQALRAMRLELRIVKLTQQVERLNLKLMDALIAIKEREEQDLIAAEDSTE